MPFPGEDKYPLDQISCAYPDDSGYSLGEKKFPFIPFDGGDGWDHLDCVSSFDRPMRFENFDDPGNFGTTWRNGADGICGGIDFAGCSALADPSEENSPENPDGYCYGSDLGSVEAFPLGSFYFNTVTIQGDTAGWETQQYSCDQYDDSCDQYRQAFCDS